MADEIKKEGEDVQGEGAGEKPKAETPPPAKKPEAASAKPPEKVPEKPAPRELSADDDELPEADDMFQLSKSALTKRMQRFSRKELKSIFGTDDVEKIKADKEELDRLRGDAEKRRQESLTKEQKLQEERDAEKRRADAAEAKLQEERDRVTFAGYDGDAMGPIEELVDPEAHELALEKLKKHVLSLDDDELKDTKKVFAKFVKSWVEKNPRFAKAADKPDEKKPPEVKKVPLTTGGGAKPPARENVNLAQKTPKPGAPNSMTAAEYRDFKKSNGLRF